MKKTFYDIIVPEFSNLKFIGYWYNDIYLKNHMKEYDSIGGPDIILTRAGETDLKGVMLGNTFISDNENYYFFLGCEVDNSLINVNKPSILFLGGFENRTTSLNHQKDTSFLALIYPTNEDYKKLLNEIGTVDIPSLF